MTDEPQPLPKLLKPGEVAQMFRVESSTVSRWANAGRIPSTRTMGGQHRFDRDQIVALARTRANEEAPMKTYDADDPKAEKPLTKAEKEAEEEADRIRDERKNGK